METKLSAAPLAMMSILDQKKELNPGRFRPRPKATHVDQAEEVHGLKGWPIDLEQAGKSFVTGLVLSRAIVTERRPTSKGDPDCVTRGRSTVLTDIPHTVRIVRAGR